MLRNDGKYEIFVIEFASKEYHPDKWHPINWDCLWVKAEHMTPAKQKNFEAFSASGQCWQETGVHGTYDIEDALSVYLMLKMHSIKKDEYIFRVMKKSIWQESSVMWCG